MIAATKLPLTGDAASDIAGRALESLVQITDGRRGAGSGIIVDSRGLIITNAHVVRGKSAGVTLHDGTGLDGQVVARDDALDLAAIRVERDDLEAIEYGDSRALRPGQLVLAVGHPLGLADAVTIGVISRPPDESDQRELIASNITLNRGNSGGPLLDSDGRLIGVNAMVAGPGLGLSIPSQTVRRFIAQQVDPQPHIGVTAQPASGGLIVTDVQPESPAEAAGIIPGDIIAAVGDAPVRDYTTLIDGLIDAGTGGTLTLELARAGRKLSVTTAVVSRA
jgi:serine protease Do